MHEMGIANSILDGVAAEMHRRPKSRALKVGVRVGELAGVDPDALNFAFDALTIDTAFAGLRLEIEYRASRGRCRECAHEFEMTNYSLQCPVCGGLKTDRISGDELDFAYLDIEDDEISRQGN